MQTRPELEALIAGIRQAIAGADQAIEDLQGSRQTALLAGDSARLDEIEIAVEHHRKENGRRLERIALLDAELLRVDERDHAARMEVLRQRAQKAADLGEEIIRKEYAPNAKKIGAAIEKLAALRAVISDANSILERNGADQVGDFDANRHVPGWQPPPETRLIEINAMDTRHPEHERYRGGYAGRSKESSDRFLQELGTVEIEETKTPGYEHAVWAEKLEDTVSLPGVIGSDPYFWRGDWHQHGYVQMTDRRRAELRSTLMGDPAPAPGTRFDDDRN